MKRLLVALSVWCLLTGAAYASPTSGTWTAPGTFDPGIWQDFFPINVPFPADVISAAGTNWSLAGATLTIVFPIVSPPYDFGGMYTGGVLTLTAGGPWDGGGTPYVAAMGPLTLYASESYLPLPLPVPGSPVIWTMHGSGLISGTGETVLLTINVNGPVTAILGPTAWMKSGTINSAEISIIPAPGAILLGVLGAGVVGWLRRRRSL